MLLREIGITMKELFFVYLNKNKKVVVWASRLIVLHFVAFTLRDFHGKFGFIDK